ncbi:putative ribokinase [Vermiconidia calcicola]|uniref:Ribokinase n=1 Tax=Vermiconidia calcicola TaxID=1690605 RepID=A0ACC3ND94_9PEZI|nr:putative ribokinase [Vermiconidia calcicola]
MSQRSIAVIGSLNIDFITRTPRIPEAGETLTANSFDTGFGGKGANQAVACARLASEDVKVRMVGNVGDDIFGKDYFVGLDKEGIDASAVKKLPDQKTGVANIIVDDSTGENRILFTANANYLYSAEVEPAWDMVPKEADVVVFQLEIPLQVVLHNMHLARESGRHIIMNPAPALLLPDFAYQDMDTLIMNETESAMLAGPQDQAAAHHKLSPEQLAALFLKWGVKEAVIVTLGGEGLVYATASGDAGRIAAHKVNVVDTTAAGDTFVGAYAVQRAKHSSGAFDYKTALQFATLAAARSVEKKGAMAAIPYLKEL